MSTKQDTERRPCSNRDCNYHVTVRKSRSTPAYCDWTCRSDARNERAALRRKWERETAGLREHMAIEAAGQAPIVEVPLPPLPPLPEEASAWVPTASA